jgi:small multidrug resistance pump
MADRVGILGWLVLLLGIVANAAASTLVKLASSPPRKLPSLSDPGVALTNWPLALGLSLYGLSFFLYAGALSRFPLSVAHPIMTAGAVGLVALASILLGERISFTTLCGLVLVVAGVALISWRIE